jgi:hypothetical protein
MFLGSIFFFGLFFSLDCTAKELNSQTISELISVNDNAIVGIKDAERIYVKPDNVLVNQDGIFLNTQTQGLLRLPILLSSVQGCYVPFHNHDTGTVYPVINCVKCGLPFSPSIFNWGVCPHCGTKN